MSLLNFEDYQVVSEALDAANDGINVDRIIAASGVLKLQPHKVDYNLVRKMKSGVNSFISRTIGKLGERTPEDSQKALETLLIAGMYFLNPQIGNSVNTYDVWKTFPKLTGKDNKEESVIDAKRIMGAASVLGTTPKKVNMQLYQRIKQTLNKDIQAQSDRPDLAFENFMVAALVMLYPSIGATLQPGEKALQRKDFETAKQNVSQDRDAVTGKPDTNIKSIELPDFPVPSSNEKNPFPLASM